LENRGAIIITGLLFGFVGLGVGFALYEGELFLMKTVSGLPPDLPWRIASPAFYIAAIGFLAAIIVAVFGRD